jgi:ectoine hydroxylase-related dioxygenase (phytanoyl-CoA dioxygenase family)
MNGTQVAAPQHAGLIRALRTFVLDVRSMAVLPFGIIHYMRTGQTPERAYQALVWLFCSSGGRVNDFLSRLVACYCPKIAIERPLGVLGDMSASRAQETAARLRRDGCVVFERALPDSVCERLAAFAAQTPAKVRRMDHEAKDAAARTALFNPLAPIAVRYDYRTADLLDNADVQALLADSSILALMQEYLGCRPVADVLSMWWHTSFHRQPDSEAAQFFHFDLDRIKWLKIFVYLTDVGPENGPHSFVRGSHRTGGIPSAFLRRGYVRLADSEVYGTYPAADVLELTAPRGSIIVEDTRGLHKGATVCGAARLVLQLQFSNSLFGTTYSRATISEIRDTNLGTMLDTNPEIYKQYT